jgi:sugar lactone lactonase YvrE
MSGSPISPPTKRGPVGHQVIKFTPEGEELMRLGTAGQAGGGPNHFDQPNAVITGPDGSIFVADGHSGQSPNPPEGAAARIVKFSPEGEYLMEWGRLGNGPGEFRTPHAMAFDSQGRLFVADRGNHRLQIFDQEGNYLGEYYEYSRVSDLWITPDDVLYAIDSESTETSHPDWLNGIRIGSAHEDRVTAFIPPHPREGRPSGVAGEGIAVDPDGNIYVAEGPASRPVVDGAITKYMP